MHSRLTRGLRPRLEGTQRTPLSSRVATGISWNPQSGLKRVKPPVKFRERTRDCSPSHAGKEGPHLAMTGGSCGFSRAGKVGNPFQTKQGNRPYFRDQEERKGSDEVVPGTSVFPLSETVSRVTFQVASRVPSTVSHFKMEPGTSLETL